MLVSVLLKLLCGCSSVDDVELDRELNLVSTLLNENCESMVGETTVLKSVFMDAEVEPSKAALNHTHGNSAADRSTASLLIDRIGSSSGLPVVYYQGSAADERNGRQYSRSHLWAKDQNASPREYAPEPGAIVAMVDVDYYVDMPTVLSRDFRPYLIYAFQPSGVCKDEGEYKFTFLADGSVVYRVSGGGGYAHHLWNYDGDSVYVERRVFFGLIPWTYSTYAIERRQMDADHQLVMLAPLSQVKKPWLIWLARMCHQAKKLEHLNPVCGNYLRMEVNDVDQLKVCTGKVGGYSQACTAARVDSAIASAVTTMSGKPTLGTIKSKMEDNKHDGSSSHVGAEILLEYHIQGGKECARVTTLESAVRRFQYINKGTSMDEDAKPGMVAFMKPLYDSGFVPDSCLGNDTRAVNERVLKFKDGPTVITNFVSKCMDEFIREFMPQGGWMYPVEEEEVYFRQPKPAQRRILDAAQHESATRKAKNFVKREAYSKVNDPRVISQINGVDKKDYAAFIYTMSDYIKTQPWYAFGKSPLEIAERVAEICSSATFAAMTDFERQDGRIGVIAREFERRLMMWGFRPEYRIRLFQLMRKQFCLFAATTYGVKYETEFARSSGSAETSDFNTLLNAFVNYMGYRRMKDEYGNYFPPAAAYKKLGLYGGDDGVSGGLSSEAAHAAASSVGQKLEMQVVRRGQPGITFLARRYGPDVWNGDLNSCCDIKRQLAKFHLTTNLPGNISREQKLRDKAFSFQLTDRNTPIVGEFVNKALELFPLKAAEYQNLAGRWGMSSHSSVQYPNEHGDWMDDIVHQDLPDFDISMFRNWVESCNGVGIFDPPGFAPAAKPNPKPGKVVVDGDIIIVVGEVEVPVVARDSPKTVERKLQRTPGENKRFRPKKPKSERASHLVQTTRKN